MNNLAKISVLIALLAYVISPVDFVPGPIDDMIMLLVYVLANYRGFARTGAGRGKYIEADGVNPVKDN